MYLINACFRAARSKKNPEKTGVVFYRICSVRSEADGRRFERMVNSDIHASDDTVLDAEKPKILWQLRLLYCVVEHLEDSGKEYTIENVVDDFRKALTWHRSMSKVIAKSKTDFPLRRDIISVGRKFRDDFQYMAPAHLRLDNKDDITVSLDTDPAKDFFAYLSSLSQKMKAESRIAYNKNIRALISSLQRFSGENIPFEKLNENFVSEYAEWLKTADIVDATQAFYLRNLRSVLGKAHEDGLVPPYQDWFDNINTRAKPYVRTTDKKVLDTDLLKKMEDLNLSNYNRIALYRDMFMFGFYCGGMELVDIANLTWDNVKDGYLLFNRRKVGLEKKIFLGEKSLDLINRYRIADSSHLFPLLDDKGNILFHTVQNYVLSGMRVIGKLIGFPKLSFSMNITTYDHMVSNTNVAELLLKQSSPA